MGIICINGNKERVDNEELKDLLAPSSIKPLKIIEDPHVGPMIQGITEPCFTSAGDVRALLEKEHKALYKRWSGRTYLELTHQIEDFIKSFAA